MEVGDATVKEVGGVSGQLLGPPLCCSMGGGRLLSPALQEVGLG